MRTVHTSIKNITPTTRNWSIKMIVSDKSPKRTAQHSPTKYQNLTLIDPEGNRLQATIFGKDIDLRNDTLHIFRSYYISNAYVKPLDARHKIEAHEYQWILNSRTIIEDIPNDEEELQPPEYNIIPFTDLHDYKNTGSEIAIMAVAIHMKPPREITSIHGPTKIQEIYVIDQSLMPIWLTMWGRFVDGECQTISHIIEAKPTLLATRLKVGSYNGLSLSSQPTSVFTLNPVIPGATPLCQWTMLNHALLEEIVEKNLHHTSTSASTSTVDMKNIIKIDDVAGFLKTLQPMMKAKFWIKATICVVDLHQIFFYMSCIGCKKGTGYEQNEKFMCYHCKYMSNAQPRCRAYIDIDDGNGRLGAVIFGEIAEEALGCTAIELMEHTGEEHLPYIQNMAKLCSSKKWIIQLGADLDQLQKQRHKNFNVLSINAVNEENTPL